MKNMKKITSLVLAGSMILAFCACSSKDQPGTDDNGTTEQPKESVTEGSAEESADPSSASGARWVDSTHVLLTARRSYSVRAQCRTWVTPVVIWQCRVPAVRPWMDGRNREHIHWMMRSL